MLLRSNILLIVEVRVQLKGQTFHCQVGLLVGHFEASARTLAKGPAPERKATYRRDLNPCTGLIFIAALFGFIGKDAIENY